MRRVTALCLLALMFATTACTISHRSSGRELPDSIEQLSIGSTTKAQALTLLGPPVSVRRQFDGDLFFYRRDVINSWQLLLFPLAPLYAHWEGEANSDIMALLFDHRGVLAGVGVTRDIDS
jgi:outer membrane protein assembly factor BamE (lipoprotein component of BamABCDE complex)